VHTHQVALSPSGSLGQLIAGAAGHASIHVREGVTGSVALEPGVLLQHGCMRKLDVVNIA
jgi:hypothetical protein